MPQTTPTPSTDRMDLRALAQAGERRLKALEDADAALDAVIDALEAAGDRANIRLASRLSGVTHRTLYRRLAERREAGA